MYFWKKGEGHFICLKIKSDSLWWIISYMFMYQYLIVLGLIFYAKSVFIAYVLCFLELKKVSCSVRKLFRVLIWSYFIFFKWKIIIFVSNISLEIKILSKNVSKHTNRKGTTSNISTNMPCVLTSSSFNLWILGVNVNFSTSTAKGGCQS
jgi:hypothetical protein